MSDESRPESLLIVTTEHAVYRRQHLKDRSVLVASPTHSDDIFEFMKRAEHQYQLRNKLSSDWAARPLSLDYHDGQVELALDDPGGVPVERLMGSDLEMGLFLQASIAITQACRKMHESGLIHRDLNSKNILISGDQRSAHFIGFDLACSWSHDQPAVTASEPFAGNLAYMAPEQSGRMDLSIDGRSDLYAVGIALYQMLTGEAPFTATDPIELIHCHIARRPAPPVARRPQTPQQVSAIVMKLIEKSMEDRYQTAAGVEADLQRCLEEWSRSSNIESFQLATRDAPGRLKIPEKLYGRERDIETLRAAYDRVTESGKCELVLVAGYSGIGKSSVVNELQKTVVSSGGFFAAGKFDQYKQDIPYSTVSQAFEGLIRMVLGCDEVELARWRDAFNATLGTHGELIVNVVPSLELVVGPQRPQPAEYSPQQEQSRFLMAFGRFVGVFARAEHPLVLFVDDLQWLDRSSLNVIRHLVTDENIRHLLLVGAYRDNEVTSSHPLRSVIEEMRTAGAPISEVVLAPLTAPEIADLIDDALGCGLERARTLAKPIEEKTGGNPFFSIQYLRELVESGLIAFEPDEGAWIWDEGQIGAKGYTENVVELLATRLNRLSTDALEATKQLACLGTSADIGLLATLAGRNESELHSTLAESTLLGLVQRRDNVYRFVHDRVQEAAYSLIADEERAPRHLCIGRLLASHAQSIHESIFDIVNHFNRATSLIVTPEERTAVAEFNLIAGRRARGATAFAPAISYLSSGCALLTDNSSCETPRLAFDLEYLLAECEFLSSNFEAAERRFAPLLRKAETRADRAHVYRLQVDLHILRSEHPLAVATAIECLALFGIDLSAHPARADLDRAYGAILKQLAGRSIGSLVDLPPLGDPDIEGAMEVLASMYAAALFTDATLTSLHICHLVSLTLEHGVCAASTHGFGCFGLVMGHDYGRYHEGYQFALLARDIVVKHGLTGSQAKMLRALEVVSLWVLPPSAAIEAIRAAFRAAVDAGDLLIACYACSHLITNLLVRGDHLDEVWEESERCLQFVRKTNFRNVVDILIGQQRLIQNLRGLTNSPATFGGSDFDEAAYEATLTQNRPLLICWHLILKAQSRFIYGDFNSAWRLLQQASGYAWASHAYIQLLDYHFYSALSAAALDQDLPNELDVARRDALSRHRDKLAEWAAACPATFADKYALVGAELARLEGRHVEAVRLYEQSARLAHENGLIHCEAIAHEVAARYYAQRGLDAATLACLRRARFCYLKWGAGGKVRQLDEAYPNLKQAPTSPPAIVTRAASIEQIDLAAVIKASLALSSEIVLEKLIETLMGVVLENAGAERGVLLLSRNGKLSVEAVAETGQTSVQVGLRSETEIGLVLPASLLHTVVHTRESVLLDDAQRPNLFSQDPYFARRRSRAVMCQPLLKLGVLTGAIYLENSLTAATFTPRRIALLELLASQAAISLENARLYTDLIKENRERRKVEASLAEAQRISGTGSWTWDVRAGAIQCSAELLRIFGLDVAPESRTYLEFIERVHREDRSLVEENLRRTALNGELLKFECRIVFDDGVVKHVLATGHRERDDIGAVKVFGTVMDVTERRNAEEAVRLSQAELARMSRLSTIGELAASIVHEVNQPLAAIVTNADACVRWIDRQQPDLDMAREAAVSIAQEGRRAAGVISGLRALARKTDLTLAAVDINETIREVLTLLRDEIARGQVNLLILLNVGRLVLIDRGQLQQVVLNLIRNSVEAMVSVTDRERTLRISAEPTGADEARVAVADTGIGLEATIAERIFEPLFTTKRDGMGMGLAICRSIIEAHRGRLWTSPNQPHGTIFQFTVPFAQTISKFSR